MIRDRTTVKRKPGLFLQPFVLSQLVGSVIVGVVEGSEVTASEYAVTSWLAARSGLTPSELADELALAPTTVSAMIDRLVQKKQVRRVRHPEDGRSYRLELTARGHATNQRNARRLAQRLAQLRDNLDGDPEEILDALRSLEVALRKTVAEK